jgi:putative ubiquitin-RnfH superfamily antitoxin RatB of RatAB toxin-antitoxin module
MLAVVVPAGTTARAALLGSPLGGEPTGLDLARCPLGIHGRVVGDDYVVRPGDRVEVYRPLTLDPRAARRAAVARGTTLGRRA